MNAEKNKNLILEKLSTKTSEILIDQKPPSCSILEYSFDHEIYIDDNKVIFGKYKDMDLFISINNNEAIYLSTPAHDIFLNSSLDSFIKYINLFNLFIQKLNSDREHKGKYLSEWEDTMIKIDKRAFYDKSYYWGAYVEDYQNGMLM